MPVCKLKYLFTYMYLTLTVFIVDQREKIVAQPLQEADKCDGEEESIWNFSSFRCYNWKIRSIVMRKRAGWVNEARNKCRPVVSFIAIIKKKKKKEMNRSFLQMMQHYKLPKVSHNGGTLYLHNHKLFCSGFGSTLEDAGNLASENVCEYIPALQQKSIRPLIFFPPFFIACYSA